MFAPGPRPAAQPASVTERGALADKSAASMLPADEGSIAQKVETLREASLDACLHATEDDTAAAEECAVLSYDLAIAEQVMDMRKNKDHYEWIDSDSY